MKFYELDDGVIINSQDNVIKAKLNIYGYSRLLVVITSQFKVNHEYF